MPLHPDGAGKGKGAGGRVSALAWCSQENIVGSGTKNWHLRNAVVEVNASANQHVQKYSSGAEKLKIVLTHTQRERKKTHLKSREPYGKEAVCFKLNFCVDISTSALQHCENVSQ